MVAATLKKLVVRCSSCRRKAGQTDFFAADQWSKVAEAAMVMVAKACRYCGCTDFEASWEGDLH